MLIELGIENFRSIKNKITLSMVATTDKSLENNLIQDILTKNILLKSAAIYGANASGKSNVIMSLNFLKYLVTNSHKFQRDGQIPFFPFKFNEEKKPTKIEVVFIQNKIRYHYSLSFDNEKIIEEFLYYWPKKTKKMIFQRKNTNEYEFGTDKKLQTAIKDRTLPNVLYLSKATQDACEKTAEAFKWFNEQLSTLMAGGEGAEFQLYTKTRDLIEKDEEMKKLLIKILQNADFGIENLSVTANKLELDSILRAGYINPNLKMAIYNHVQKNPTASIESVEVNVIRKGVLFNLENEESEGTKRIFSLLGPWIHTLKNGNTLIIDELEIKLHPLLCRYLIKLFHDPQINTKSAQLIFTTHNTQLLDQELFRRDQIWFTEKNPETNNTSLYSLTEFSPRKDKSLERGYLSGKYGGLPFINEATLDETKL